MQMINPLSLGGRVNAIGVVTALLLLYLCLSNNPWWTLRGGLGGENTLLVEVSPFVYRLEILQKPVSIPAIPYLNLAAKLTFILAAITTFIGSIASRRPWSKPLISLNGLLLPIMFLVGLLIASKMAGAYFKIEVPLNGEFTIDYVVDGIHAQIPSSSSLTTEYYIAVATGLLSVLTKALHRKIQKTGRVKQAFTETGKDMS